MFRIKEHVRRGVRIAAIGAAASLPWVGASAQGAVLSFDPDGTPATPSGGTGAFDNGVANFSNGSSDVAPTSADDAHFAGTPGTVTPAAGGVSVNSVNFDVSGYTVTANGIVTLNAGNGTGLSQNVGSSTINAPIQVVSGSTGNTFSAYAATGATMTTGSITMGTYGAFQKTGAGKLVVNGLLSIKNQINSFAVSAGTLQLVGANNLIIGSEITGGGTIGSY